MKKPIIAVDIDDVLTPHFQDLITWYNNEYDTHLTLINQHRMDPRPWGTESVPTAVKRVHRFFETTEFKNALPFQEAIKVLRRLSSTYDLVAITSRDEIIEKVTREWLDKHFTALFTAAHFTARYNLEGKSRSKIDVCLSIGAEFLIDDAMDVALEAAGKGIKVLLFGDYPWNQSEQLPQNVSRVSGWNEVERLLLPGGSS